MGYSLNCIMFKFFIKFCAGACNVTYVMIYEHVCTTVKSISILCA